MKTGPVVTTLCHLALGCPVIMINHRVHRAYLRNSNGKGACSERKTSQKTLHHNCNPIKCILNRKLCRSLWLQICGYFIPVT